MIDICILLGSWKDWAGEGIRRNPDASTRWNLQRGEAEKQPAQESVYGRAVL